MVAAVEQARVLMDHGTTHTRWTQQRINLDHASRSIISWNGFADLTLAVPILANSARAKQRQPVPHVDTVDLPHQVFRERVGLGEEVQRLLQLRWIRVSHQCCRDQIALPAPTQAQLCQGHAARLGKSVVFDYGFLCGLCAVSVQCASPACGVDGDVWIGFNV
eukprot:CAMPEP_0198116490 /NCGR_PEP_ID=MMETSP1442-20131203/12858_1 /TAXON_ID= /ORGANISM="Craspedostauros australis, Strain CCMP3328" /LENGTH=162 /DNA_ID=CAMNT_0043774323 /DNA_START=65 /DNA_END=553 /DNA_ORIENTATION=+